MSRYTLIKEPVSRESVVEMLSRAQAEVVALCHGKRWRMCVPVEAEDSDVVLGDALYHARELIGAQAAHLERVQKEKQQLQDEIDASWRAIENSYDIETREYFERHAPTNGFKWALCQAVHHLWKRDPKVADLLARVASMEADAAPADPITQRAPVCALHGPMRLVDATQRRVMWTCETCGAVDDLASIAKRRREYEALRSSGNPRG